MSAGGCVPPVVMCFISVPLLLLAFPLLVESKEICLPFAMFIIKFKQKTLNCSMAWITWCDTPTQEGEVKRTAFVNDIQFSLQVCYSSEKQKWLLKQRQWAKFHDPFLHREARWLSRIWWSCSGGTQGKQASLTSAPKHLHLFSPQPMIWRVHLHTPTHTLFLSPFLHYSLLQTFLIVMASK